jgi:hypothetical protein
VSLILPWAHGPAEARTAVASARQSLLTVEADVEIVLVPWTRSATALDGLGEEGLQVLPSRTRGWGAAVRDGLSAATGDVLCFVNPGKSGPAAIAEVVGRSVEHPDVVWRANRRTRDSAMQKLGSLAYNVEVRLAYRLATWDVNGTPKAFPRRFDALLALASDDELYDLEFAVVCERERYPVLELPLRTIDVLGPPDGGLGPLAALRLFARAARCRNRLGRGAQRSVTSS